MTYDIQNDTSVAKKPSLMKPCIYHERKEVSRINVEFIFFWFNKGEKEHLSREKKEKRKRLLFWWLASQVELVIDGLSGEVEVKALRKEETSLHFYLSEQW